MLFKICLKSFVAKMYEIHVKVGYGSNAIVFQLFLETNSLPHILQINFQIARVPSLIQASLLKICLVGMYLTCSHSDSLITCRFMLQVFSGSDKEHQIDFDSICCD